MHSPAQNAYKLHKSALAITRRSEYAQDTQNIHKKTRTRADNKKNTKHKKNTKFNGLKYKLYPRLCMSCVVCTLTFKTCPLALQA